MQTVSSRWGPALVGSHGVSTKINALYNGVLVAEDIDFVSGSVRVDAGSDVRRSLSLTVGDPAQMPALATDQYAVYGQRLYVESGLAYLNGTAERVPLGTFVITSISGDVHTGPLAITAAGLEILLKRAVWDTATSTSGHGSAAAFIGYHVTDTVSDSGFVDESTRGSFPLASATWDANTDKWASLSAVAASCGARLFCNAEGTFVLADIPDPDSAGTAVWDVTTGENGVMVSASAELSAEGVFNRVVVTGENAGDNVAPVRAEAKITDPADPLRYGGPFGQVTKPYSSSLVTSGTQAQAAANAMMRAARSPNRSVSLATIPNPALDADDVIRVNYGAVRAPELHIVRSFDIPLTESDGAFTIETVGGKDDSG